MSRGYRIAVVAAGLAFFAAAATWIALDVLAYQQDKADQRQQAAAHYAYHPNGTIKHDCMNVAGQFDRLVCVMEKTSAEQQKTYAAYDLEAQQDMAVWTKALLWVSIIGTGIAFFGVVFVAFTLRATSDQVELSRKALVADFRPWVDLETVNLKEVSFTEKWMDISVDFSLKNHGRAPAQEAWVEAIMLGHVILDEDLRERLDGMKAEYIAQPHFFGSTIFPNKTIRTNNGFRLNRTEFPNNLVMPFLIGIVAYRSSIDNEIKFTEFAFATFFTINNVSPPTEWPTEDYTVNRVNFDLLPFRLRVT